MNELQIKTPDDSGKYYTTNVNFEGFNYNSEVGRNYHWRWSYTNNNVISPNHNRSAHEPTIHAIKKWLSHKLGLGTRGRGDFNGRIIFELKSGETATIFLSKNNSRYSVQGMFTSKEIASTAIARTIYRSCFERDAKKLETYCFNNILLPENVSYALENRAPYHWYKKGIKVDVRFNVKLIGPDECALEISDGMWAPISVNKLNTYMNYYWKGQKSSSWFKARLTPKKLWKRLLKTEPTEGQLKMMIAFLEQNRTDALVQERAFKLVKDMSIQYKDRLKVFWDNEEVKAILVRGKLADWVITDNQFKSEIQAVSTYVYQNADGELSKYKGAIINNGNLKGPICIDNMTKNSSVGDQFAARAFALLNDTHTCSIVSTIKHYLTEDHYDGQTHNRIDFSRMTLKDLSGVLN